MLLSVYFILLSLIATYGTFADQENLGNQPPSRAKQRNPQLNQPPSFCNGLECPQYRLVKDYSSFEHREYEPSKWISTQIPLNDMNLLVSYKNLFQYMNGSNAAGAQLSKTTPIRLLVPLSKKTSKSATMSIFLSANLKNPPMPIKANHFLHISPKASVYVKSFHGITAKEEYVKNVKALIGELSELGLDYDRSFFGCSIYPSATNFSMNYNEAWLLAGKNQQSADFSGFPLGFN